MELLKGGIFQQDGINCLLASCPLLLGLWDGAGGKGFLDKRVPRGECVIASRQPEVHGKTYGATDVRTGDRMVRARIRVVALVVMAIHLGEQTAHMLAQGVIEDQRSVGLRTADRFRLLEQRRDPTVIDTVLEPRGVREKAGQIGFVSAFQHTAGAIGQTVVVQNDQACQVMLEMAKLAPILTEIAKDVRMGGHDGSGSDDGKLHEAFALSSRGWGRA